ncbi:MAG: 2'-5' RNA ligase family protein [Novosphingobium sp.]
MVRGVGRGKTILCVPQAIASATLRAVPNDSASAPFIVTGELPVDVFSWANGLRTEHFPPERNHLKAHVTLFHSFAPSLRDGLPRFLAQLAGEFAAPEGEISGLMDLGGGTALSIRSEEMLAVRLLIADHFRDMLTQQDQGGKRLHITIQNKVDRRAAQALQADLGARLLPRRFVFTGLGLHLYRNPHWEPVGTWKFRGKHSA